MKTHVPISQPFAMRFGMALGRIDQAQKELDHAVELKQVLIDAYLIAHGCEGKWEILPDGSAFVPAEEKEVTKEEPKS